MWLNLKQSRHFPYNKNAYGILVAALVLFAFVIVCRYLFNRIRVCTISGAIPYVMSSSDIT